MMQTAIVTYPDEHQVVQPILLPVAPSSKLTNAFQSNTALFLYEKKSGNKYCWKKDGYTMMYNIHNGIVYEWFPKPTLQDVLLKKNTCETTIFKKDGTVTQTKSLYRNPNRGTLIWPASPSVYLVDGVEIEDFTDSVYYINDDSEYESEDESDEHWEYERHEHPGTGECFREECVPCPSCGGIYDGMDYGGLGCSRECAYGDWMEQAQRERHWR